ncbi:MAG: hypothetical protein HUJ80_01770 [Firmicutes bacterium]|nr:hypothetical protein [Bacillota bacterium]
MKSRICSLMIGWLLVAAGASCVFADAVIQPIPPEGPKSPLYVALGSIVAVGAALLRVIRKKKK